MEVDLVGTSKDDIGVVVVEWWAKEGRCRLWTALRAGVHKKERLR